MNHNYYNRQYIKLLSFQQYVCGIEQVNFKSYYNTGAARGSTRSTCQQVSQQQEDLCILCGKTQRYAACYKHWGEKEKEFIEKHLERIL